MSPLRGLAFLLLGRLTVFAAWRLDRFCCVVQILCRRTKNHPVLIGEPGGVKTAIVEGRISTRMPERELTLLLDPLTCVLRESYSRPSRLRRRKRISVKKPGA
jgi:hypothetical protein